ncbi:MAG: intradiol ring-cleavage dioxygenase [Xenococcaceae cyanobacterium]
MTNNWGQARLGKMILETRRNLLKKTGRLGIGLLATQLTAGGRGCPTTPRQTEGPFYPLQFPVDQDNDLTLVEGHTERALGEKIIISGRIVTPDCNPIEGARVEIWQACASGRYNHDYDPNQAPLDPNFQDWGYATTGFDGKYSFTTIKPGSYPVTSNWKRPPHIHFKVAAPNLPPLITQLYFSEEEELNQKDRILQRVPPEQRPQVITKLTRVVSLDARVGQFNIVLG